MRNDFKFLIYRAEGEDVVVQPIVKDESIWLTQKMMAELFGCSVDNISLHLKNVYSEGELDAGATVEEFSVVQDEGGRMVNRKTRLYNLDAIISVGYRINSGRATHFRLWRIRLRC